MDQHLIYLDGFGFVLQTNLVKTSQSVNTLLLLFSSFLVFLMQPGFALLEVGQVRAKNTANVAMKNIMDWSQGVLTYFLFGAAVASVVGTLTAPGPVSLEAAFVHFSDPAALAEWLFGAVFAMTAATIVSGAVVGRIKFVTYLVFGVVIVTVIYPVAQGLAWEGLLTADGYVGRLLGTGYIDFAGATVVHMTGGIAGLVAAARIGPRNIRYQGDTERAIPGHSVFFSLLGAFVLAFGWYGFNVGSYATVLSTSGSFEGPALATIAVNTTLAMGAGTIAAAVVTALLRGVPDPLFSANGMIAGLVAITAGAAYVTWWGSILIGAVGGALVMPVHNWVVGELQIDDAISVFPVHAVSGAAGTLLVPLFGTGPDGGWQLLGLNQLVMQAVGIGLIGGWTVVATVASFTVIERVLGLDTRVTDEEEELGLDASEHNITAYPEFAQTGGGTAVADEDESDTGEFATVTGNEQDTETTVWRGQKIETSTVPAEEGTSTTVWRGQEVEISQRTEYERELEALTSRLELALDETDTGVWEWNLRTDEFIIDTASERLLGYDPGAFPGTLNAFLDRVHPDDVAVVEQQREAAVADPDAEYDVEFRVQLPEGSERWIRSRGVVKHHEGDPTHILGIQTDLTDRKQRERELERQNERLDQFVGMVSHDLRNPLSIADTYLNFAEDSGDSEDFTAVREALDRMDEMIADLLTMARADTVVSETDTISLAPLCQDAWQLADTDGAELVVTVEQDETIEGDPDLLQHVFENLFRNAVDHNTPPVTVTVGTLDDGLYVADDGTGIPAEKRDEVFEHGYTSSESGTGFGLSIISDLVEAHGWEITVTDGTEGGARFEIRTA